MIRKYITPGGKELEIYNEGFAVKARFIGGGELPAELAGSWTSKVHADMAINKYLVDLPPKKEKLKLNKEDYQK